MVDADGWSQPATVDMLLEGYACSLRRLEGAVALNDAGAAFRAVFEALNWATSIDERICAHWTPEGQPLGWAWRARVDGGEVMAGVRFARNRVHYHWADAIYLDESGGVTFPLTFPVRFSTWRWRALADLPDGTDDRGNDVYLEHLQHNAVQKTLLKLALAFELVGRVPEPPQPRWTSNPE